MDLSYDDPDQLIIHRVGDTVGGVTGGKYLLYITAETQSLTQLCFQVLEKVLARSAKVT